MTAPDPHASLADIEMLTAALGHVFAPWVQDLDLRVLEARAGEVTLALPITRRHVDDTDLTVTGDIARDWMTKAQAFAGGATDGPAARITTDISAQGDN